MSDLDKFLSHWNLLLHAPENNTLEIGSVALPRALAIIRVLREALEQYAPLENWMVNRSPGPGYAVLSLREANAIARGEGEA